MSRKRAAAVLFAVGAGLIAGNYFFTNAQVSHLAAVSSKQDTQTRVLAAQVAKLQTAVLASCAFAADVGSVPVPPQPRPSKLGVSLVADSRAQWRKLHCPGTLPPPPGFARWAAYYHLPDK